MGAEPITRHRIAFLPWLFIGCLVGLLGKVGGLQLENETWDFGRAHPGPRHIRKEILPPRRGTIYTRGGTPLAVTVDRKMLTANPRVQQDRAKVAKQLGQILGMPDSDLLRQLKRTTREDGKPNYYVRLCRDTPEDALKALEPRLSGSHDLYLTREYTKFPGVNLETWHQRRYPYDELAAQLLGVVRNDGVPTGGIEMSYAKELAGTPGSAEYETDAQGFIIPNGYQAGEPAKQGKSLVLTIDEHIQRVAETAINQCLSDFSAKLACALAIHPPTGQILAWACAPSFNPNRVKREDLDRMGNTPVSYVFEPGSTLKPLVAAAVIDNTKDWDKQQYECQGVMTLGKRQKHCWILSERGQGHGMQGLSDGIRNSCNIAMMRFGLQVHPQVLYANFEKFGLTRPTGCDCPRECSGILAPASQWGLQRHADVCYGQGIAVTPLQLATAISAIANEGKLMRPYLVSHSFDEWGRVSVVHKPHLVRRATSKATAKAVTDMMVRVVEEGTGKRAAIEGVQVAGKTGSAQMAVNGTYPEGHYICTFTGFAPAESPRVCVLVMVVEPQGTHWGSEVCAAAFKATLQEALLRTEIQPVRTNGFRLPEGSTT